ncbi:MAG: hypothetical protein BWY21_00968 [Parcubacteria group bacterium ADurb.Bin216]|jgi:hypothetical protein|nr:MAG: hypothetical protein BWY21_00968 [Parcubacteria group bacterium ADurb.Bin216]
MRQIPILRLLKIRLWNCGFRLWWHRLWIRQDEFHKSFDIDLEAMSCMSREEQEYYLAELTKRRNIAHERDIKSQE